MCGIVGLLSRGTDSRASLVEHARDLLAHRGPEGAGLWTGAARDGHARITLGHRRLCIIDVSDRSAQPLLLQRDGRVRTAGSDLEAEARLALVYNGEIYNYIELRTELQTLGHHFSTSGDAEVLLLAYAQWGPACLERLNGMFAFAVWDADRDLLFLARDRFGEKPLHFVHDSRHGLFAFASEMKALIGMGAAPADLDARAVYRYFRFGEQAGAESTMWHGIRRLMPAHCATVRFVAGEPEFRTHRYWSLPQKRQHLGDREAVAAFRELFADSVRLRLRSDVPVGSSLSGGIDSSSVVCQVHRLGASAGQLAFTASMDDPELDESGYAELVVRATNVAGHSVIPTAGGFLDELDRLFYHQEEPFPSTSIFASYLVQRLAREHGVTVLLDGQGADEYLAGYAHYPAALLVDLARSGHFMHWMRERRAIVRRSHIDPVPARAALWHWWHARTNGKDGVVQSTDTKVSFLQADVEDRYREERPPMPIAGNGLFDQRLRSDLLGGHLQELLRYADRNSMAFSRETRLPFLDHRLVEFAMTLPLDLVFRDGESKRILRQAMRGIVPDAILDRRDKVGFATPWKTWTEGQNGKDLTERLRAAEQDLVDLVRPGTLSPGTAAALGIMAISSIRQQFRSLSAATQPA